MKIKKIFITSARKFSGKTAIIVGLSQLLKDEGHKVGYFKPIGRKKTVETGDIYDNDAIMMKQLLNLDESLEEICPVLLSREFILKVLPKEERKNTIKKIIDTFEKISANYDIVIIEGQQRNQDLAVLGLCNPVFGKFLQTKSLLITTGNDYSLMDDIFLQKEYFALNKAELAGVLFNNVSQHAIKTVKFEFIPVIKNQTGLRTFGIIPKESKLISPTVDDIYKMLTVGLFFIIEVTTGFLSNLVTRTGLFLYDTLRLEVVFGLFEKSVIDIFISDPIIKPLGTVLSNFVGPQMGGILFFILWFALIVISIDFVITKGLKRLIQTDWAERVSAAFNNPFKSFATGFSLTWLVGSSSIGTSLAIPMLATKMVTLDETYPYICGCGLATTVDLSQIYGYFAGGSVGVMLGAAHVLLNIFSLVLWLATPLRVVPLRIAKGVGRFMAAYRYSALLLLGYAVSVFILLPLIVILFL